MTTAKPTAQPATFALSWCGLLVALYVILIFVLPANTATMQAHHLSPLEYRALLFTFSIPAFFIWFTGFIGYAAMQQYAYAVRKTPEGPQFERLAKGSAWLAWSLPLPTILALVLNGIATKFPEFHPAAIIITNYVNLLLPLVAFTIISTAAHGLLRTTKLRVSIRNARIIMTLFIAFAIIYCFSTFSHINTTSLTSSDNPYFLQVWLIVLTIVLPYLYTWFIGILGAFKLAFFSRHVQGLLYKRSLLYVAAGIIMVIASSIALQYTNTVIPRVGHLEIDIRFMCTVVFRIIGGFGFILLAIGARRLKKIEEV